MCAKCDELDEKIIYYRRFIDPAFDATTRGFICEAVAELEAERIAVSCFAARRGNEGEVTRNDRAAFTQPIHDVKG